jgi:hypothetical protein
MSRRLRTTLTALTSIFGLVHTPLATATPVTATTADAAARPPQFVALAFDGSLSLDMWNETRQFTKELAARNIQTKFTYFISGVYFLGPQTQGMYVGPHHSAGHSDIGFGKDAADVSLRTDQVNLANQEGHEIASHANGHFDGSQWSEADWTSEFTQFNALIFGVYQNNKIPPTALFPSGWTFAPADIVGFRAPLLGYSKGLFGALKTFKYRYDTSQTAPMNYWPAKNGEGEWNFPLAEVVIAGTAKRTLSMDYNFYYAQTNAKSDPAHSELYEKQMYDTYMNYFLKNYNGNRAPVHIGHHFSKWNGGAYWNAMKHFAATVCGMPEVKCGTYKQLADFMDATTPTQRLAFSKGNFEKSAPIKVAGLAQPIYLDATIATTDEGINVSLAGPHSKNYNDANIAWTLDGQPVASGARSPLQASDMSVGSQLSMKISNNAGDEILTRTFGVQLDAAGHRKLSVKANEDRALLGDLPEAHPLIDVEAMKEAH